MIKPYTVLMLYPDYLASQYGEETYLAHVSATDPTLAIKQAQGEAFSENELDPGDSDPADFATLAVFPGHLEDLKP